MFNNSKHRFAWQITSIIFLCLMSSSALTITITLIMVRMGFEVHPYTFRTYVIIAFLASSFLGTVIAAFATRKLSEEYATFKDTINQVANGNFDVAFPEYNGMIDQIGSDLNMMVKELKGVQILRQEFVANFSHELKTPMISINGFSELLLADEISDEERKEYAKIIYDESSRLLTLAQNTLLLSKLEGQALVTERTSFYIDELIDNSLLLMAKQIEGKNLTVNSEIAKINYYWDSNLLSQVFINLINNAIKYSNEGGEITLKLYSTEEHVVFVIADNGVGMNEQTIERIFDRYYQADSSHKTEGNGLGLAIVEKIIKLAGGKITVNSKIGEGSTFTVYLPELSN